MWYNHRFYRLASAVLLVLLILLVLSKVGYLFRPIGTLLTTLSIPAVIALVLYYILRPLVRLLERYHFPKLAAIATSILLAISVIIFLSTYMGSVISIQFTELVEDLSAANYESIWQKTLGIMQSEWLLSQLENIEQNAIESIETITLNLSKRIPGFFSALTNIGTAIVLTPFILFYLLKDDQKFSSGFLNMLPEKHKVMGSKLMDDIDLVLSTYISGQMLVALVIGILMFIGYLIFGINYPVVLALFGMITAIIPFFGPILGILPAVLVSLTMYPFMIVKVLIVMVVVQQIEGNLVSPQIMGKRLLIHPLTVIILLISGASLLGFIGLLIIIPVYAVLKVSIPIIIKPNATNDESQNLTKESSTDARAEINLGQ